MLNVAIEGMADEGLGPTQLLSRMALPPGSDRTPGIGRTRGPVVGHCIAEWLKISQPGQNPVDIDLEVCIVVRREILEDVGAFGPST